MFEGNIETFDLTAGQPCFIMNKDMTVMTNKHFDRTIQTKYEEGDREKYFNY